MPDDFLFPEVDNYTNSSDVDPSMNPDSPTIMNITIFSNTQTIVGPSQENDTNSSSDEAPDDVGFAASKMSAMQEIRNATEAVKNQQQKLKEKRRQKQELLAAQKEKKTQRLTELASKRLPSEILESIANSEKNSDETIGDKSTTSQKEQNRNRDGHTNKPNRKQFFEPASSRGTDDKSKRKRHRNAVHQFKPAGHLPSKETVDFIPVESKATEFHVRLNDKHVSSVVSKVALLTDWRNQRLYNRKNQRETTQKALAKAEKQAATGIDQFPTVSGKLK